MEFTKMQAQAIKPGDTIMLGGEYSPILSAVPVGMDVYLMSATGQGVFPGQMVFEVVVDALVPA